MGLTAERPAIGVLAQAVNRNNAEMLQAAGDCGPGEGFTLSLTLKPGNIMLGKYGETLVVDWGTGGGRCVR